MAEAVEVAIEFALLERLKAFGTAQSITIAQPNVAYTPPDPTQNAKYLRATFLPADTLGLGVGTNSKNQHYGLFQVDVFYGTGAGELAPRRIAAALVSYFKRGTTVTKDNFVAQVLRPPYCGTLIKDDPWVFIPVRISYTCFASNPA